MNDFFANIYELIPIGTDFNNELYDAGAYALPGVSFLFFSILLVIIYYYGLRGKWGHPRYRTWGWLIVGLVLVGGGNFGFGWYWSDRLVPQAGTFETSDYIFFGIQTAIYGIIIYCLFCFLFSRLKLHHH